jgi:hypothetical protein
MSLVGVLWGGYLQAPSRLLRHRACGLDADVPRRKTPASGRGDLSVRRGPARASATWRTAR